MVATNQKLCFSQTKMGFRAVGIYADSGLKRADGVCGSCGSIKGQSLKIANQKIRSQLLSGRGKFHHGFFCPASSQKHLRQSHITSGERITGRNQLTEYALSFRIMIARQVSSSQAQMES